MGGGALPVDNVKVSATVIALATGWTLNGGTGPGRTEWEQ